MLNQIFSEEACNQHYESVVEGSIIACAIALAISLLPPKLLVAKKLMNVVQTAAEHVVQGLVLSADRSSIVGTSGGQSYRSDFFQSSYCGLLGAVYLTELKLGNKELADAKKQIVEYWGGLMLLTKLHPILSNFVFSLAEMKAVDEVDYKSGV